MNSRKPEPWSRPLPALEAALRARYPNVTFDCMLHTNAAEPEMPFQTVVFVGRRQDLAAFVPKDAFMCKAFRGFVDENGDRWSVTGRDHEALRGYRHSDTENSDQLPPGARRWPQKGLETQVSRMLRKAFARPRERATG
jgi:hypothetical protein